ncbi:uncharacterized protein LOC131603017 isoform X2 [Vicia villosa]|uniref:uncharacterized protein LOC131603017 isoform X2 n=1 Tax=Vicia villosa TaxID=3911 RepID=UPI00273B8E31|nr:uncharacterized protein LOC131603017 isoform X2 [Vicia villosa]
MEIFSEGRVSEGRDSPFFLTSFTMPHRTRPMTALLLFTSLNAVLCATITPVYDFVCFLPYWERRRERRRLEREASNHQRI